MMLARGMSRLVLIASVALYSPLAVAAVTHLTLGQDVDWPPYAFADENGSLQGFGKDIADGMNAFCADVNITVVQVPWSDCWTSAGGGALGQGIDNGTIDGCLTYTNTLGVRQQFAEFSGAILEDNNAAGLMTLLKADGRPKVDGMDDLTGKKIVDVGGWAPTGDTLDDVINKCTNQPYGQYTLIVPSEDGNDAAMKMLKDGDADAMYVYANQAKNYQACTAGATDPWDCDLWSGFGTEYAYVQTGQLGYFMNGTTLIIGKKGSGKAASVDSCLHEFMQTEAYKNVCVKHDLVSSCYRNSHFPGTPPPVDIWNKPTSDHTSDCSDGYCPCTVSSTAPPPTPAPTPAGGTASAASREGHANHVLGVVMAFIVCVLAKVAV